MKIICKNKTILVALEKLYGDYTIQQKKLVNNLVVIEINELEELPLLFLHERSLNALYGDVSFNFHVLLICDIPEAVNNPLLSKAVLPLTSPIEFVREKLIETVSKGVGFYTLMELLERNITADWLTRREIQTATLLNEGLSVIDISNYLEIANKTVYSYTDRMRKKMKCKTLIGLTYNIINYCDVIVEDLTIRVNSNAVRKYNPSSGRSNYMRYVWERIVTGFKKMGQGSTSQNS